MRTATRGRNDSSRDRPSEKTEHTARTTAATQNAVARSKNHESRAPQSATHLEEGDDVLRGSGEPLAQLLLLGRHPHGAVVGVADARHDTALRDHRDRPEPWIVELRQRAKKNGCRARAGVTTIFRSEDAMTNYRGPPKSWGQETWPKRGVSVRGGYRVGDEMGREWGRSKAAAASAHNTVLRGPWGAGAKTTPPRGPEVHT